jgi:hypothetical protein
MSLGTPPPVASEDRVEACSCLRHRPARQRLARAASRQRVDQSQPGIVTLRSACPAPAGLPSGASKRHPSLGPAAPALAVSTSPDELALTLAIPAANRRARRAVAVPIAKEGRGFFLHSNSYFPLFRLLTADTSHRETSLRLPSRRPSIEIVQSRWAIPNWPATRARSAAHPVSAAPHS